MAKTFASLLWFILYPMQSKSNRRLIDLVGVDTIAIEGREIPNPMTISVMYRVAILRYDTTLSSLCP